MGQGPGVAALTGERAHYELSAGRDVKPFIRAIEGFASTTGLLPEQVWDEPDRPEAYMFLGRPTGSAMPLMWAHAEYIKLLRSVSDGRVFDLIPEVAHRYLGRSQGSSIVRDLETQSAGSQRQTRLTLFAFRFQLPLAFTGRPTNGSLRKIVPHRIQFSDSILSIFRSRMRSGRRFALPFSGRSRIAGKDEITW